MQYLAKKYNQISENTKNEEIYFLSKFYLVKSGRKMLKWKRKYDIIRLEWMKIGNFAEIGDWKWTK